MGILQTYARPRPLATLSQKETIVLYKSNTFCIWRLQPPPIIPVIQYIVSNMATMSFNVSETMVVTPLQASSPATSESPLPIPEPPTMVDMFHNPDWVPHPLSPCTTLTTLNLIEHPNYTLTTNIVRGLAATVEKREEEWQLEEDHLNSHILGLEDRVEHYKKTFDTLLEGYVKNNGYFPLLIIPGPGGLFQPAKWIKKIGQGQVAMLADGEGPSVSPLFSNIYTKPLIQYNTPTEPLPAWFRNLLVGPGPSFHALLRSFSDVPQWGLHANTVRFHDYHDQIAIIHAQLHHLKASLEDTQLAQSLAWLHLEMAQATTHVPHLEAMALGCSVSFCHGSCKKAPQAAQDRGRSG